MKPSSPSVQLNLPVSPLSKTLGLAWRLHRAEVLPVLAACCRSLTHPNSSKRPTTCSARCATRKRPSFWPNSPRRPTIPPQATGSRHTRPQARHGLARRQRSWRDRRTLVESALNDPDLRLEASGWPGRRKIRGTPRRSSSRSRRIKRVRRAEGRRRRSGRSAQRPEGRRSFFTLIEIVQGQRVRPRRSHSGGRVRSLVRSGTRERAS